MKRAKLIICMAAMIGCFFHYQGYAVASEGEEATTTEEVTYGEDYTVIRVNAEDDSNGTLLYAIDSDAPEAFGTSNEFTVKKGSEHTVYVKDAAGNISAQVYRVPDADMELEVNIGYSDTSSAAMLTDEEREAVEGGGGTVEEQVITDNSSDAERLFFTVTTKDEHVFYLMVDQSRSDNNVYLLDQVTDEDLYSLAAGDKEPEAESENTNLLSFTQEEETGTEEDTSQKVEKASGDLWFWVVLILLGAAAFYYYKIYKPKQEKMNALSDARDLDEFEADDEDEDDEVMDFSVSQEEKDELLQKILSSDDLDADADEESDEEELSYDPDEDYMMMEETEEANDAVAELDLPEDDEENM